MSESKEVIPAAPVKRFLSLVLPCLIISQGVSFLAGHPSVKDWRLQKVAALAIAIQWVVFVHASGFLGNERTERYYDLTGSLTFLLTSFWSSTFVPADQRSLRQTILTYCVQIWAVRLGSFLFSRISKHGGVDSRFVEIKKSLLRFFGAWTLQGVWVFLTALPVFALNQAIDVKPLTTVDYVGLSMWAIGFLYEVVADTQKSEFKDNKANKDKWITGGVWSLSRHPNYAGEILLWLGLCISATQGMPFLSSRSLVSFISPLFVFLLLVGVSGVPMLEKASDKRWGGNKAYELYKAQTPTLIPFVGRRGSSPF